MKTYVELKTIFHVLICFFKVIQKMVGKKVAFCVPLDVSIHGFYQTVLAFCKPTLPLSRPFRNLTNRYDNSSILQNLTKFGYVIRCVNDGFNIKRQ